MAVTIARVAPQIARVPVAPTIDLIDSIQIDYGPVNMLGRFFLLAQQLIGDLGISMCRATLSDLAALQSGHKFSWALFPPMLDVRLSAIPEDMSYALVGRNAEGDVVCAQGGRIYSTGERSLDDIARDQSFFYAAGTTPSFDSPRIALTAPSASTIAGTFVYSGALWVRPDYRGQRLSRLLPRLSRAFALAHWNTRYTIALVSDQIAKSPLFEMYGYQRIEPTFRISGLMVQDMVGSLMWMDAEELVTDLARFLAVQRAQVDVAVAHRGTEDQATSVRAPQRQRHA